MFSHVSLLITPGNLLVSQKSHRGACPTGLMEIWILSKLVSATIKQQSHRATDLDVLTYIVGLLMAWCKFLCISSEAKLLPAIEHTVYNGCHSVVLCLVIYKHIIECFKFQGNLMTSWEDMYSWITRKLTFSSILAWHAYFYQYETLNFDYNVLQSVMG